MVIEFENEFDMCKILRHKSDVAVMIKTVVDEFEFPEYIVKTIGPFSTEKVFSEYTDAEAYYNDLYFDRSHSISKW